MSRFTEILATLPETPRRSVVNDAIQETMASQGTVISKAQLELLGVREKSRRTRVKRFELYKAEIARGIYKGHAGFFETKVRELIESSPLLPPVAQNAILEGVESDFWIVGTRGIIEADSRQFHRTTAQILRDAERDEILIAAGFQILRILWRQVQYEPEATLRRIVEFHLANIDPPDPIRLAGRLRTC